MTRPPRLSGLGLGGRLDVRRRQAQLHETIAEQLAETDVRAERGPADQPALPEHVPGGHLLDDDRRRGGPDDGGG